jgi:hypothetical protein
MRVPLHASATDCPLPKVGIVCSNDRPLSDPMEEIESCFPLPCRRALRAIRRHLVATYSRLERSAAPGARSSLSAAPSDEVDLRSPPLSHSCAHLKPYPASHRRCSRRECEPRSSRTEPPASAMVLATADGQALRWVVVRSSESAEAPASRHRPAPHRSRSSCCRA